MRTEEQQEAYDRRTRAEIDKLEAECSFAKISEKPENVKRYYENKNKPEVNIQS